MSDGISVKHSGRITTVSVRGDKNQYRSFRNALLGEDFFILSETENSLELGRKIKLFQGDWPMKVTVNRDRRDIRITYFMYIPWTWIGALSAMVVMFLPFANFRGAPLAFLLAIGVIALAVYKQRFDFSPNASWQGPPRKQWNERMNRLLTGSFKKEIRDGDNAAA